MMLRDELEGIYAILLKDLKAYYLKPPNISWGILFPIVLALAFTLRNPRGLRDLAPGLVAMAALFGTTSMEAIVVTFEKRVGALERLYMAPLTYASILLAKVLGGAVFGGFISAVMTLLCVTLLGMHILHPLLYVGGLALSLIVLSSLGALIAFSVREVFEAQTLSNYFRFPMIFLCGVFIPVGSLPLPLRFVAYMLPLTYTVELLRASTLSPSTCPLLDLAILILFSTVFLLLTHRAMGRAYG